MRLFGKDIEKEVTIIAEIGVNHEGSLGKALELIELAAGAGADAVKFQSYTPERYISSGDPERLARVTKYCLDLDAHKQLKRKADSCDIHFFSTAVSEDWVEPIAAISDTIKIASGDLTFEPVIRSAARTGRTIILSVGLGEIAEIDRSVGWLKEEIGSDKIAGRVALMHCVVAYPTPVEQANVSNIGYLQQRYGLTAGYSNHVVGPSACYAAAGRGTKLFEVHFTDQKEGRSFRDHALSFNPDELAALVKELPRIAAAIGEPGKFRQLAETANMQAARKGIVAAKDLAAGIVLTEGDLQFARPAIEFSSGELSLVVGARLNIAVKQGFPVPRAAISPKQ